MCEELLQAGVRFLPWIGNQYENGFINGHRFMILGESFYNYWDGGNHPIRNNFASLCIQEVIDRGDCANFWKTIEQALLNEKREDGFAPSGCKNLWNRLAFYNFVQREINGGARIRPRLIDFRDSYDAFRVVLNYLRPNRVWVCGHILWDTIQRIENVNIPHHCRIKAYHLDDGTQVWFLRTVHPSSGVFSWRREHPVIMSFLEDPQQAANRLNAQIA